MTKEEFCGRDGQSGLMGKLAATYAHRVKVDVAMIGAYWDLLGRFPLEAIGQAMDWYIRDDTKGLFPTAAQLAVLADRAWQGMLTKERTADRISTADARRFLAGPTEAGQSFASACHAALARLCAIPADPVAGEAVIRAVWADLEARFPHDWPEGITERRVAEYRAGVRRRQQVIAGDHARGEAKREPCSDLCDHRAQTRPAEFGTEPA